jgi:hypothetical protein
MIEPINPLFTTLILIISVTVNGSNATTVSEENYCYDQLEMLTIAMNPLRNKHKYGKAMIWQKVLVTTKIWIETINNFVNGVKR